MKDLVLERGTVFFECKPNAVADFRSLVDFLYAAMHAYRERPFYIRIEYNLSGHCDDPDSAIVFQYPISEDMFEAINDFARKVTGDNAIEYKRVVMKANKLQLVYL